MTGSFQVDKECMLEEKLNVISFYFYLCYYISNVHLNGTGLQILSYSKKLLYYTKRNISNYIIISGE